MDQNRDHDRSLRDHLLYLLKGGGAHADFEAAVAGLPPALRGAKPPGVPHSPWQLLEHLRLAQWDILEFSRDPGHVSPKWPEGYWPQAEAPADDEAWDASLVGRRGAIVSQEVVSQEADSAEQFISVLLSYRVPPARP